MAADDTHTPGDTGADADGGDSPAPVPYERFREVNEAAKDARARAAAAEEAYQAVRAEQEAAQARLEAIERRFAPEPDEPVWTDPADEALKKAEALEAKLAAMEDEERRRAALRADASAIDAALDKAGVRDVKAARADMAERYGAAKWYDREWDPEAAAKELAEAEAARAEAEGARAEADAQATRSPLTGGQHAPAPAAQPVPPRPNPTDDDYHAKMAAWEGAEKARIMAQHG